MSGSLGKGTGCIEGRQCFYACPVGKREEIHYGIKRRQRADRRSDIIGYIGRDIEDAIILGKIKREEVPTEISSVLGTTNKEIVNTIILDIVEQSMNKPYIKMSEDVYNALFKLKKFNYENIYKKSLTSEEKEYYRTGMNKLFTEYLDALDKENHDSPIYIMFLNNQNEKYLKETSNKRKVIDFLAGMTDDLFISELKNLQK